MGGCYRTWHVLTVIYKCLTSPFSLRSASTTKEHVENVHGRFPSWHASLLYGLFTSLVIQIPLLGIWQDLIGLWYEFKLEDKKGCFNNACINTLLIMSLIFFLLYKINILIFSNYFYLCLCIFESGKCISFSQNHNKYQHKTTRSSSHH